MSKSKLTAYCMWLIASIFYAYQYILRVMPNIMLNDIMKAFNIDSVIFGQFSGAYYLGYCAMHLPLGLMLDRYGPKKIMSLAIISTVIGLLPILLAKHWIYPVLGRFIIGAGSSGAILSVFNIIRIVFAEKYFTRMLSFSVTIGLLGAIYGSTPVSYLLNNYGYKIVLKCFMCAGVILAIMTYFIMPNTTQKHTTTVLSDIKTVISNKKAMIVCILAGCMVGPLEGFADAWGSEFLKTTYNIDNITATALISYIYIGMFFAPVLSAIAEKTNQYLLTIIGAGIVMCIIFITLIIGYISNWGLGALFFICGICCAYQILAIYYASTYVPTSVTSLATAIANMIIMSFGYVFHSTIGLIINIYQDSGTSAFKYGVAFIPIMLIVAIIGLSILWKTDIKS
jgi:MFS family permease